MSLGALTFLNPWLLAALASLPIIYWLLRTVPPRPKQIAFPPTRILVGIENREKTPIKSPWWLLLIRLLAAALVIFALAEPILNPEQAKAVKGTGPVLVVVDNGWASAPRWQEWSGYAERLITEAETQNKTVMIVSTASAAKTRAVKVEAPGEARSTVAAIKPQPFAPDRRAALDAIISALREGGQSSPSIFWLSDGIDYAEESTAFAEGLAELANGSTFAVVTDGQGREALGLDAKVGADGKLAARVLRANGPARDGLVHAYSARGERLGEAAFKLDTGVGVADVILPLPLELRNQVTRLEISNENSAGSVNLLDQRSQWQRVGLISGESQEKSQPLLAPLYYINKAIQPFAEVIHSKGANLAEGLDVAIKSNASVLILADIGTLSGEVMEQVDAWVKKGGVLVRFAGPRLEKGGDELLPVGLRIGGRTLGGALSWSTPQPLGTFEETSLFAGLTVPSDVTVKRQVLADPAQITPEVKVWARLKDGTPLVTAARRGQGQLVLFHVTANSDWSSLPMSGLFVEMLQRITALGSLGGIGEGSASLEAGDATATDPASGLLAPLQTLDGFGLLKTPPPTAQPISLAKLDETVASLDHPPGYYGPAGSPRAVNAIRPNATLAPLGALPTSAERRGFESAAAMPLKSWMLAAALALLFADILAVLLMQFGGLTIQDLRRRMSASGASATALLFAVLVLTSADPASSQTAEVPAATGPDAIAQQATAKVTFGYVLTGDSTVDTVSRLGLTGLGRILATRTALEPGEPAGIDITKDEVAFYPILYWPVPENATPLAAAAAAKIDAYMKQGGMIIFDTRDYGKGGMQGFNLGGGNQALQRLLSTLDIPRVEPVPEGHVLTKSFYLLKRFPGRWEGGELWVEAGDESDGEDGGRRARRSDGVSSILVTSNDFAAAWALDDRGRPLYPTVGGENQREMAFRTGVNIVMHALTGNYKADQVHVPALLERLGQ